MLRLVTVLTALPNWRANLTQSEELASVVGDRVVTSLPDAAEAIYHIHPEGQYYRDLHQQFALAPTVEQDNTIHVERRSDSITSSS
jgi:hypothetical protein